MVINISSTYYPVVNKYFFPFGEWEGYIDTKSQAININGILKVGKEQEIYIYSEENKHYYFK